MHVWDDTIAAVASPTGGGARGVLRVSGPKVAACLAECFRPDDAEGWQTARTATVFAGKLELPELATSLDCDVYYWPTARSYTRQPTAELQTIGSPPLVQAALDRLVACGARPARPGEFTLRAFLAGRLDLTQAEAVLGVIDARSAEQLEIALSQLAGGLAKPLAALRGDLLDLLAHLEAGLDFADEEIEFVSRDELTGQLSRSQQAIEAMLAQMGTRSQALDRPRVVLVGAPNVGKSSLFNALAGRDAAIVSELAGTTRDYLVAPLVLEGVECELVDTAGHEHEATGTIAMASQRAMTGQRRAADLSILCLDSTRPIEPWECEQLRAVDNRPAIVVSTKVDAAATSEAHPGLPVSSFTGHGLCMLRERIAAALLEFETSDCRVVAGTAARARTSLAQAAEVLAEAAQLAADHGGEELIAAELRLALDALGEVAGTVYTDDILDRIFSRFCIGK
jgi:tRNA modification GTPase